MPIRLGRLYKERWAYRALDDKENKKTIIDETELLYFLNLAKATGGGFQIQIDNKPRYFFIFI